MRWKSIHFETRSVHLACRFTCILIACTQIKKIQNVMILINSRKWQNLILCRKKRLSQSQKLVPQNTKNRLSAKLNSRKNYVLHGMPQSLSQFDNKLIIACDKAFQIWFLVKWVLGFEKLKSYGAQRASHSDWRGCRSPFPLIPSPQSLVTKKSIYLVYILYTEASQKLQPSKVKMSTLKESKVMEDNVLD